MVIPRASRNIRSYRIPVGLVYGALLFALVGTFTTGHSLLRAAELAKAKKEVAGLRQENDMMAGQLDQVRDRLLRLSGDLAGLTAFEEQMRVLANLEPTDEDVLQVGIGGPTIGGRADLLARPTVLPEGPRQVDAAREDLETLSRQARLLEESFSEVLDALKSRKQELAHVPSIMPVENCWVTTRFGYRSDPFTGKRVMHYGVDLSARRGEPVVAAADGKVTFARKFGYLGLTVEIDHGNGIKTRYGHSHRIFVKQGQEVVRGQVIAAVGSSGRSTGPHLHYEVRLNDRSVDPAAYMIAP